MVAGRAPRRAPRLATAFRRHRHQPSGHQHLEESLARAPLDAAYLPAQLVDQVSLLDALLGHRLAEVGEEERGQALALAVEVEVLGVLVEEVQAAPVFLVLEGLLENGEEQLRLAVLEEAFVARDEVEDVFEAGGGADQLLREAGHGEDGEEVAELDVRIEELHYLLLVGVLGEVLTEGELVEAEFGGGVRAVQSLGEHGEGARELAEQRLLDGARLHELLLFGGESAADLFKERGVGQLVAGLDGQLHDQLADALAQRLALLLEVWSSN